MPLHPSEPKQRPTAPKVLQGLEFFLGDQAIHVVSAVAWLLGSYKQQCGLTAVSHLHLTLQSR